LARKVLQSEQLNNRLREAEIVMSQAIQLLKPAEELESPNKPIAAGAGNMVAWGCNKPDD